MKHEPMKSVPVDPNNPEKPIKLIVQATQYLVDEMSRLHALSSDAAACQTAFAGGVLVDELNKRIELYSQRGLQALVNIVNDLVSEYDRPATSPEPPTAQTIAEDTRDPGPTIAEDTRDPGPTIAEDTRNPGPVDLTVERNPDRA